MKLPDIQEVIGTLQPLEGSTWALLSAGARARQAGRAAEEADLLSKAASQWTAAGQSPSPDITTLLGPKPDPAAIYHQVGAAHRKQMLHSMGIDPAIDFATLETVGNFTQRVIVFTPGNEVNGR